MAKQNKYGIDTHGEEVRKLRGATAVAGLLLEVVATEEDKAKTKALVDEIMEVVDRHNIGLLSLGAIYMVVWRMTTVEPEEDDGTSE